VDLGWIDTLEEYRDVFIIAYMAAGVLFFLVATVFAALIGFVSFRTVTKTRGVIRDNVQPALENVRDTSASVRTTVAFISDNAVTPVVKVYGAFAGARRFIAIFTRIARGGA